MKIECKLQREGGSVVTIGEETYHFKPDGKGRHVCDVRNKEHATRLLQIPEAYLPVMDGLVDDEGQEADSVQALEEPKADAPRRGRKPRETPQADTENQG